MHKEIQTRNEEIERIDQKYMLIMEKNNDESKKVIDDLTCKISTQSKEIVEGYKLEINNLLIKMTSLEKEKNLYFDEKLKIQQIIDQQVEQVEYLNNK